MALTYRPAPADTVDTARLVEVVKQPLNNDAPMHLSHVLLLAPPLIQWESLRLLPWAISLACVLAAGVVWFYPAQVRFVRWPWRWAMPGLRVTALAVLALALARPVATRVEAVGQGGTVAVLVDRSGSMDVADTERSPAELVALADSFGLLPASARGGATTRPAGAKGPPPPTLAQLTGIFGELRSTAQQAYRDQGDLEYSRVSGQGIEAAQARLNDTAARVAALGASLAQMAQAALPGPADTVLRERLKALGRLPLPDARGTWVSAARDRIEQAGKALSAFQASSDARLFQSNTEIRDVCAALKTHTRFQLACSALLRPVDGLAARLGEKTPLRGFAFADDLSPLGPLTPNPSASLAASDSSGIDDDPTNPPPTANAALLPVSPDGGGTDLAGSVTAALARLDPRTVRAVVLFSDGREVGADVNRGVAPAASGVPVFTVAVAPAASPRDVCFGAVQLPHSAFVGETINIRAALRATGFTPEPGDVRLSLGGAPELARGKPGRARDGSPVAEFSVKLDQPGAQQITLSIPAAPDEATVKNNTIERWVKVLPEKIHVAAFAAAPGWDFQFLRSALSRTPWVRLAAGVLDPDHPKLPLTPEQILQQDVLVLDDVPAEALDADQWDAVYNKLVKERGGSVILVAGSDNAIQGYQSQIAASALLPFDPARVKPTWKVWPGEKPNFRVVPAAGWEKSDFGAMLRLDNSDAANRRWLELPAMFRVMPIPVGLLRANSRPLLVEAEPTSSASDPPGVSAVLSEARPGLGRSLLLGTDETWRWRLGTGERFQDRFWVQLVRYAAEEPYAARKGAVALDVDAVAITRGEPVRVRARLYDAGLQSAAAASVDSMRLEISSAGQLVRTLPLSQAAVGSGRWEAVVSGLAVGNYQVRLLTPPVPAAASAGPDDTPGGLEVPLHVVGGMEAELRNLTGDPERLRRLAESTGGEMLRLDEIAGLPDRLANLGESHPRVSRLPLWDSPWLLVFVVACLAAEWALRKRFGLA
jgi:hypothetical protein